MNTNEKFDYASEIWGIANYLYGSGVVRSDYHKVILPFTMLRRLECALEPTRDAVLKAVAEHEGDWGLDHDNYCNFSKKAFYNVTAFRLNTLGSTDTYDALEAYLDGFSPNARDIFENFSIKTVAKTLQKSDLLYDICRKFAAFNLSPEAVSDREMSNIYEHLIQRFGETINEQAEDFMTPKDVVRLATGMIFANEDEVLSSDSGIVRTLYDPTMGTGGFLADALDQVDEWNRERKMVAPTVFVPYGQELVDQTYAMGKASMMLRNISDESKDIYDSTKDMSSHIKGPKNTLNDDQFPDDKFDYIVSNPPFGQEWKKESVDVMDEARLGFRGRFGAGLPSVDDGTMLFMQHVVSKMKDESEGGSHACIVTSASPLFTGDAGSGPSNIRRWLFKKDVVDCIVKLPDQIFYRTGINTYLWIMNTRKPEHRKGMVQLIDASGLKTALRKNQGNKRYEISASDRQWIIQTYIDGHDHGNSVMVPAETFMYRKVTTQRPLRAAIVFTEENIESVVGHVFSSRSEEFHASLKAHLLSLMEKKEWYPWSDLVSLSREALGILPDDGSAFKKSDSTILSLSIAEFCSVKGPQYPIAYKKNGQMETDSELKDTENIPLDTSFDAYMEKEVLPYAPETWIDESVTDKGPLSDGKVGVLGVNISFNRFFYHYEEPRKPEEIAAEIRDLEKSLDGFTEELLG